MSTRQRASRSSHAHAVTVALALDVALDVVRARDVVQVAVDLRLRRAQPRPVAPLREGERVQVARHVARGARVAVVEPRPAQVRRRSRIVMSLDAVALELDRRGDPPKPAPTITTDSGLVELACGRTAVAGADMRLLPMLALAFSTFARGRVRRRAPRVTRPAAIPSAAPLATPRIVSSP